MNTKLEQQLAELRSGKAGPKRGGTGPVLSRTGSVERNVEDQRSKYWKDTGRAHDVIDSKNTSRKGRQFGL